MFKKKIIAITVTLLLASASIFSSESATAAYVEGCKFYADGEWTSAKIMLKKAVSYEGNFTPEAYYMLITAEVYDGDNKAALEDCNVFLKSFPDSKLYPRVRYYKGRLFYSLGEYDKAIIELSDFCHQYVENDLYSHALFYIGESLFAGYKYEEAMGIFERVVNEFPESDITPAAQYRIDTILQQGREEKLLYLLKQTGEEYLSAKEEYEKQIKMFNSEAVNSTKDKLVEVQTKNKVLEKQIVDLENQIEVLKQEVTRLAAEKKAAEELAAKRETVTVYVPVEKEPEMTAEPVVNVKPEVIESSDSENNVKNNDANKSHQEDGDLIQAEPYDETAEQIRELREKAKQAQQMLNSK